MRTRFSLFRSVLLERRASSELEHWMMNWTMKFRMPATIRQYRVGANTAATSSPWHWSRGRTFHLVEMTLSSTCSPKSIHVMYNQ